MSNQEVSRDRDRTRTVDGVARIAEHLFEPTARGTFSLHRRTVRHHAVAADDDPTPDRAGLRITHPAERDRSPSTSLLRTRSRCGVSGIVTGKSFYLLILAWKRESKRMIP